MLAIYKYKVEGSYTEIKANVIQWLDVGWQEREGCFVAWALVNPNDPPRYYLIKLIETGESIGDTELKGYRYLGSVNLNIYVSHFFVAEINPKTKEVLVDENNHEPFVNKEFDFTWSPDHLSWLDPNINWLDPNTLEDFFKGDEFINNYE